MRKKKIQEPGGGGVHTLSASAGVIAGTYYCYYYHCLPVRTVVIIPGEPLCCLQYYYIRHKIAVPAFAGVHLCIRVVRILFVVRIQ